MRRLFASLAWSGAVNASWDHSTANWIDTNSNLPAVFQNGDAVTFGDTGAGTVMVEAGGVAPSQIAFNSSNNYVLDGGGINATSGAALTKSGTSSLTLQGAAANTGFRTSINGGTIFLNKTAGVTALPFTGFVAGDVAVTGGALVWNASNQVADGVGIVLGDNNNHPGTLNLNGNNETFAVSNSSGDPGSVVSTGSGTLNLTSFSVSNGTVTIGAGGAINVSNSMSFPTGTMTVGGTLSLGSGASTFFGNSNTTVQGGGLITTSTGAFTTNGPITVQANGVMSIGSGGMSMFNTLLTLNSDATNPGRLNLGGDFTGSGAGGALIYSGGAAALPGLIDLGAATRIFNTPSGFADIRTVISGSGGVTKNGNGFISFGGANTYSGATQINAGYFQVTKPTGLGTTAGATVVANNVSLDLFGQTVAENITFSAGGALRNESGNSPIPNVPANNQPATLTGTLAINGPVTMSGNNQLNISNAVSGPGSVTVNIFPAVQFNGTAANTYSGKTTIQSGTLILNKPAGTNAIGAAGNPAGDVVINSGTLRWDASNQIIDGAGIVNSNGTLNVNGRTETLAAMTMDNVGAQTLTGNNGSVTFTNQAILYRGSLNVATGGSFTANTFSLGDGNAAATGNIFGTLNIGAGGGQTFDSFGGTLTQLIVRSGGLIQTDGGLLLLRGNSYFVEQNAAINIGSGGLEFGNAGNTLTLASGATNPGALNLSGNLNYNGAFAGNINNFGANALSGVVNVLGNRTINVASDNLSMSARLNVPAGNTLTVTSASSSHLNLTRANTLAGSLAVQGNVDHAGFALTVGQTLSGAGTITGSGPMTVTGTGSPGTSNGTQVGTLNTSNVTMAAGSTYAAQLETSGDQFNIVSGGVNIAGSNLSATGTAPNSTYMIIQNDGNDPVVGTFNGLPEGATLTVNSRPFTITYVGGSGNDVVLNGNTPPVAVSDSRTVAEDGSLNANDANGTVNGPNDNGVLANDSDQQNDGLTATLVSGPSHGSLTFNSDGTFVYTPDADYNGPDNFSYKASDGQAESSPVQANINVTEVNDAPTAANDSLADSAEDTASIVIPFATLLANDSKGPANESSQNLTIVGVSGAVGGSVAISGTDVIFTPAADFNGAASFHYTVEDDGTTNGAADSKTDAAVASFNITEVNDAPTGVNDSLADAAEDSASIVIPFATLLANDSKGPANESGQSLTVTSVGSAVGGTVAISGTDVIFTPSADYNGPASFSYTLSDNGTTNGAADPKTDTASASFTITEVNDAPTGANDSLADAAEDSASIVIPFATLLANDSKGPANESGQALTITAVGSAVGGSVAISGTDVIFTPAADYNGAASFSYTLQDNGTTNGAADPKSDIASASFAITEVNDAPTAANDSLADSTEDSASIVIPFATLLANDSRGPANESSQDLTITGVSGAVGGTVSISGTDVIFTPAADFNGAASFHYTARDNGTTIGAADFKSDAAVASFNITEVNDAPTGVNDSLANSAEDTTVTIPFATLLGNDSKGPANESGQSLTITSVGSAVGGTVSISGTNVVFTPTANYNGPASFSYTLQDNGTTNVAADPKTSSATASFTITPVNDAPVAANNSYTTAEDTPLVVPAPGVLGNDSDIDSSTLTASLVSGPGIGLLVFNSNGSFSYTPVDDFTGTVTFTYRANDGSLNSNLATVTINVASSTSGASIIPDPCGDGDALLVIGTSGNDSIHVSGNGSSATVTLNGTSLGTFSVERIIIRAEEGDDVVQVEGSVAIPTWQFGETGNDRLNAGNAPSVLMGGAGNDELLGGSARDMLVGGSGADRIVGNSGDDILIAAYTDHDKNLDALCHIMEEWTRTDAGFNDRVDHLKGTLAGSLSGGYVLNASTCHDDVSIDDVDKLTGSAGDDWYIYDIGSGDRATGVNATEAGEAITNI